jgi:hypothetical protein
MSVRDKALLAVVLILVVGAGLLIADTTMPETPKWGINLNLRLERGQMVDLKIGGEGQIVEIRRHWITCPYGVKIQTDDGPKIVWLNEFELVIK